ncbi:iron chelate uptake ABC transporter family permease subunit, partial [Pseudomonas sp. SIMBA_064]
AIAFSLIGLFTFMATDAQLRDLTFWNMGSLAGASWKLLAFLAPWVLVLSWWLMRQWRVMNALLLGAVLLITTWGSRKLGLSKENEITLVFCGSKKSLASGIPLATVLFGTSQMGIVVLPLMIFHQMQLMVCAVLARRYA